MTAKERQRKFRENLAQNGLTTVTAIVPEHLMAEVQILCRMLRENPSLELGPVRDSATGKFRRIK